MVRSLENDQQNYLINYLMKKLAPLLVRIKPSCLINLSNSLSSFEGNSYKLWLQNKTYITETLGISARDLQYSARGVSVFFYDHEKLLCVLDQPENRVYLSRFGYANCMKLDDYLDMLRVRFHYSTFPHEIGIFLGYPLKDVKGFIEKGTLPLVCQGRWKVYDRPGISLQLMRVHQKAEEVFSIILKNRKNPLNLKERLSTHFGKILKRIILNPAY